MIHINHSPSDACTAASQHLTRKHGNLNTSSHRHYIIQKFLVNIKSPLYDKKRTLRIFTVPRMILPASETIAVSCKALHALQKGRLFR